MGVRAFLRDRLGGEGSVDDSDDVVALAEELAANPRTVELRDGRRLGYAACGDPDGEPLLVCHGFPNSRVFGALFDEVGREHGFRVLCPDRPGIGVSDPAPDRALTDWPADVADLFDRLGVDSARVLGISGGGPYALATAALEPRTDRAAVVCGIGPMASVGLDERLWYYLARFTPRLSRLAMWSLVRRIRRGEPFLESLAETAGPPDDTLWTGTVGRVVRRSAVAAVEHHGLEPLVTDTAVYGSPWGFDLSTVEVPTALWYARADILVPPEMGLYLARELPTAEFHLYPGLDHLSVVTENEPAIVEFLS
jgi:pimeloyl-ACP methyl ester carboxylesterase